MAVLKHPQPPRRTSSLRRCYDRLRRKDVMGEPILNREVDSAASALSAPAQAQAEKREAPSTGLLDLEKELTCSICTDILYQPLTLLDCLHTFCGGCLKEWFKWQGMSAAQKLESERGHSYSQLSNPYTCPSCRASVRETRPNASITTLLDMWLQANPGKDKNEEDKREVAKGYTKGENVLPDLHELRHTVREMRRQRRAGTGSDSEGAEMVTQRDRTGSNVREARERSRRGTEDSSGEESRRRRRGDGAVHGRQTSETNTTDARQESERRLRRNRGPQPELRALEHQSSLRSLFSVTDMDSQEMEEQIMRQITEEGLLDGIDLSNMDVRQEEELSERIARAFRRRHREQQQQRRQESERRQAPAEAVRVRDERQSERERGQERQSRPPVSRPRLLEAAASGSNAQRRASSQGSGHHPSRPEASSRRSTDSHDSGPASRSVTDLTLRTSSRDRNDARRARLSSRDRSATNPEARSISETWRAAGVSAEARGASSGRSPAHVDGQGRVVEPRRGSRTSSQQQSASSSNSSLTAPTAPNVTMPVLRPPVYDANLAVSTIPQISCTSCSKAHIEHELHYVCHKCSSSSAGGMYALCIGCYRVGKGCRHWFGFGQAAITRYERQFTTGGLTRDYDIPHKMTPERYVASEGHEASQTERPSIEQNWIWQRGKFCDICFEQANECHWSCDVCNDGEWGYCNNCCNQARHCTHPLLPRGHTVDVITNSKNRPSSHQQQQATPPTFITIPPTIALSNRCTECHTRPIPASPLFHCPACNAGDYNLCVPCYTTHLATNRISPQNGPQGWRRCPQGHRMLVVTFDEDQIQQQQTHHSHHHQPTASNPPPVVAGRRILLEGVVGGWALHDGEEGQGVKERNQDGEREAAAQLVAQDREEKPPSPTLQRWSWRDPDSGGGWKHKKRPSIQPRVGGAPRRPSSATTPVTETTPAPFCPPSSASSPPLPLPALASLPPSGGYGVKMQALWSRVPDRGVADELAFPRGAVVEEVVDINGDWCWGVYCRGVGLFPGGWARVV